MTAIGRRDRRVSFERAAPVRSALGPAVRPVWAVIGHRWARVIERLGGERRQAAVDAAVESATFIVPDDPMTRAISAADRIGWDGAAWDIHGIARPNAGEIEFTATTVRGEA